MSILPTKDGSNTYVSPIYNEAFHSRHGAISESQHVFIEQGLFQLIPLVDDELRIFEMGFGSGLNLLLTALHHSKLKGPSIQYDSIEKHPLSWDKASKMDFCHHLEESSQCRDIFEKIHTSDWDKTTELLPGFYIHKMNADILRSDLMEASYHLIYYDAFAPNAQPELWSQDICHTLFAMLKEKGMLTTYCAQGQFKRNLKAAGFEVKALPGPPGKREMTVAIKS